MCHSDDARPPLPPISGGSTDSGDIELTSAGGTRVLAHFARAAQPTGAGMVVMPDVRGLHDFYRELADRFAEAGIDAVAIDYFGRTAPDDRRDESFPWREHVERTVPAQIDADVAAGAAFLRSRDGGSARAVFTVGFCFGGSNSWRQSADQPGLAGAIGFYGRPSLVSGAVPRMRAPILMLVAGADFTPVEEFEQLDRDLEAAGVPHEMRVYEGAPHSFFDRTFTEHREACDDAWRRMLAFVERNLPA